MLWSPNTQLHYPFQNTAKDYSGNARNGTVNGSGVYATKPNGGRCLYFDGVGDYVATPSFGLTGTVVVFAADIRCIPNAAWQGLLRTPFSLANGYLYCYRNGDLLIWTYSYGSNDATKYATLFGGSFDDTWLNLLVVCDYSVGGKVYFYRNGGLLTTSTSLTGSPVFPATSSVKYIGVRNADWDQLLTAGYLANVYLGTLPTMPAAAQMLANAKRLMLGFNPIW